MRYYIDIAHKSLNKHGEELCGDNVEVIRTEDSVIIVLSDGLGSGVKANILATLTSKIAATMLKEGVGIEETVGTIVSTLPECSVRKLAYSTFTMIQIYHTGEVYIAEYDNPPVFLYRKGYPYPIEKKEKEINGKLIFESRFQLTLGDMLAVVSDGAVHAGVGAYLNLGWQWENIEAYLQDLNRIGRTALNISSSLITVCDRFYDHHPGDDTTVIAIKIREPEKVDLFAGPPEDPELDPYIVKKLMEGDGKKVICGGTTANIVARILRQEIQVDMDTMTANVPPMAYMKGFDLVTEGILTLKAVLDELRQFNLNGSRRVEPEKNDGASRLIDLLMQHCTHLHLWVGKAINPAHQNPNIPSHLNIKLQLIQDLAEELKKMGKEVELTII